MKKILKSMMMVFPLITLLAGCGGTSSSENRDNMDPDQEVLKPDEFDKDGRLIVSFFGIDLDDLQSQTKDTKLIMDYIQNRFNISLKYINGAASSWDTILAQNIGVDDVPDVFFHDAYEPAYSSWLNDHYLFNYSRYLPDYPNLKAAFDRFPQEQLKTYLGGDLYSLPIVTTERYGSVTNAHSVYYRRDWYNNLVSKNYQPLSGRSLLDPENPGFTYLNWYDLLEGFTKGDPDGNGLNDTYGYIMTKDGGVYWWYPFLSMFGVQPNGWHFDEASQSYKPDNTSADMKEALLWIADMFDKGFINSNYATTTTQSQMKNEFVNGQGGMMVFNNNYGQALGIYDLMENAAVGKEMINVVRALPIPSNKYGEKTMFGHKNNYGFRAICNDLSISKKRVILSLMDWMLSEEGKTVLNYGLEGVHYTMEGEKRVSKLGKDTRGFDKTLIAPDIAPGIYRIKGLVSWDSPLPEDYKNKDVHQQMANAWPQENLVLDPLSYANAGKDYAITQSTLKDLTETAFKNIVSKTTNAKRDVTWDNFIKKYQATGSSYINAINISAATWRS